MCINMYVYIYIYIIYIYTNPLLPVLLIVRSMTPGQDNQQLKDTTKKLTTHEGGCVFPNIIYIGAGGL